ncbi:MAG: diguanylate cyclase, partial [Rhodocyclaceae bacterium]|nr:diguanylate cyclase [Rhodocyclaceae bacterium]
MAAQQPSPSEIARDVLVLLAKRRLQPSPENFAALYYEVAKEPNVLQGIDSLLKKIASRLPAQGGEQTRAIKQMQAALGEANLEEAEKAFSQWLKAFSPDEEMQWNTLIDQLLRQWETNQAGWTTARKRESLDRVLLTQSASMLYSRLQGLLQAWARTPEGGGEAVLEGELPPESAPTSRPVARGASPMARASRGALQVAAEGDAGEMIAQLRELFGVVLETIAPPLLQDAPELLKEAGRLAAQARAVGSMEQLSELVRQLRPFAFHVEILAGDMGEVRAGLLHLLQLLLENIDVLVVDDQWMPGQIGRLRQVLSTPNDMRALDDAETCLKEVIDRQGQLKHDLVQSQQSLRELLTGFIAQLASMTESTGSYHGTLSDALPRLNDAKDIQQIRDVLDVVIQETASIREETQRAHDELVSARDRAQQAEQRIAELQAELEQASHLMRHDQLTGVQNRRGMQETFMREAARSQRHRAPICVGLLDLDNFKALNDTHGHDVGDQALIHLTSVVRQNLRPSDSISRMGGEEFVIIYPDTSLENAADALVRLQRELTRAYFLANDQRLLITFSAGVSEWVPGEDFDVLLKRADEAMYQAKQAG